MLYYLIDNNHVNSIIWRTILGFVIRLFQISGTIKKEIEGKYLCICVYLYEKERERLERASVPQRKTVALSTFFGISKIIFFFFLQLVSAIEAVVYC